MNKERLNELLDSIYELEGLVHLALTRDDSPERLPELIVKKGEELARHAAAVAKAVSPSPRVTPSSPASPTEEQPLYVVEQEQAETGSAVNPSPIEEDMQSVVETVFEAVEESYEDAEEVEPQSAEPRGKLVFSINDRYRFKRELFNNSDADFNNTLALVASMEDYDEAEDYFLGELQWDQKRGEVVDFLEILKRYFKE